jgi:pyruvate formate lyase activating enzyme
MRIMKIPIKGFQKTSMIDYPGKMCSVLFLPDCNFRCPFCQNPDLIFNARQIPTIRHEDVFSYLESRRVWIDGVCITGGEPTLHSDLPEFCGRLKLLGFLVKLDTNGTNPEMLENLLKEKLVDFVAMDIKGPIDRYDEIACVRVNKDNIQKSVELIRESGADYEFRTTVVPRLLREEDLKSMGEWLEGSKKYVLQQFRPAITLDRDYQNESSYPEADMKHFGEMLKPYFQKVELRI